VISWYLSLGLAVSTVIVIIMIMYFDKRLVMQYEQILSKEHKVAALLQDYLSNIKTVITLHLEDFAKKELVKKMLDMYGICRKNYIFDETKWISVGFAVAILEFLVILVYAIFTYKAN
jgi:ABC-type bacteriocin/lantibiotic exporter with double-glycine peptidase domain